MRKQRANASSYSATETPAIVRARQRLLRQVQECSVDAAAAASGSCVASPAFTPISVQHQHGADGNIIMRVLLHCKPLPINPFPANIVLLVEGSNNQKRDQRWLTMEPEVPVLGIDGTLDFVASIASSPMRQNSRQFANSIQPTATKLLIKAGGAVIALDVSKVQCQCSALATPLRSLRSNVTLPLPSKCCVQRPLRQQPLRQQPLQQWRRQQQQQQWHQQQLALSEQNKQEEGKKQGRKSTQKEVENHHKQKRKAVLPLPMLQSLPLQPSLQTAEKLKEMQAIEQGKKHKIDWNSSRSRMAQRYALCGVAELQ